MQQKGHPPMATADQHTQGYPINQLQAQCGLQWQVGARSVQVTVDAGCASADADHAPQYIAYAEPQYRASANNSP